MGTSKPAFDVWCRLAEVFLIQSLFYLSVGAVLIALCWICGTSVSLSLLLSSSAIDLSYSAGFTPVISFILSIPPVSFAIYRAAGRPKECLDFASTLYILHLLITCSYELKVPLNISWWILHGFSILVVSTSSELLCIRREAGVFSTKDEMAMV
uniref:Protein SYS1 homolog n=1 Tax=Spongospora subterranea TaxID=70186 RepID=A0A0H5QG24_9EUKA|eukprot:CRZ00900.1 hypothetical protein [Spongospora subterranea]